jgi:polysaccharide pyruvyl transferase WcaK-like protein
MDNVKIIGYYNHKNIGDEQYKITFLDIFKGKKCEFIDCDKLNHYEFTDKDLICVGGGDVLCSYFIDKLYEKFKNKKITALSVGLPFKHYFPLNVEKFKMFEKIYLRSKQDISFFKSHLPNVSVSYVPDISVNLTKFYFKTPKQKENLVGITIPRDIHYNNENYHNIIKSFAEFVDFLINSGYIVSFIAFNTNDNENDEIVFKDIKNKLCSHDNNFNLVSLNGDVIKTFNYIRELRFYIVMRFHSCLFSIYNRVPFIPVYVSRKIKNLLKDIDWSHYHYRLDTNDKLMPINVNVDKLVCLFNELVNNEKQLLEKLENINTILDDEIKTFNGVINQSKSFI